MVLADNSKHPTNYLNVIKNRGKKKKVGSHLFDKSLGLFSTSAHFVIMLQRLIKFGQSLHPIALPYHYSQFIYFFLNFFLSFFSLGNTLKDLLQEIYLDVGYFPALSFIVKQLVKVFDFTAYNQAQ